MGEVIRDKAPLLSQIRHDLSLAKPHAVIVQRASDEKFTCARCHPAVYPTTGSDLVPEKTSWSRELSHRFAGDIHLGCPDAFFLVFVACCKHFHFRVLEHGSNRSRSTSRPNVRGSLDLIQQ